MRAVKWQEHLAYSVRDFTRGSESKNAVLFEQVLCCMPLEETRCPESEYPLCL